MLVSEFRPQINVKKTVSILFLMVQPGLSGSNKTLPKPKIKKTESFNDNMNSCLEILAEGRVRCTGSGTTHPLPKYKMYRTLYSSVVDPDP
jgi:hypothetical protein